MAARPGQNETTPQAEARLRAVGLKCFRALCFPASSNSRILSSFLLSEPAQPVKIDSRKLSPEELSKLRRRAFEMRDQGVPVTEIARILGTSRPVVHTWYARARVVGREAVIQGAPRGRKKNEKLKLEGERMTAVLRMLVETKPSDFGIDRALWESQALQQLIADKFGVRYSKSGFAYLLTRLGLGFRKAADEKTVSPAARSWVRDAFPALRAEARRQKAVLFFLDEPELPREESLWEALGPIRPVIAVNGYGQAFFRIVKEAPTAEDFRDFLVDLRRDFPKRLLYVVCDASPIRRAKVVSDWIALDGRIELKCLPADATDLKPAELCSLVLKTPRTSGSDSD